MTKFEILFGIKEPGIKENCILLPILPKGVLEYFGVEKFIKGKLYGAGNSKGFTLIQTGIGAGFVGDAVLYLKNTPCKNVILFGSCGLVKKAGNLDIGSIVTPFNCYSNESFSELLLDDISKNRFFYPDEQLFNKLLNEGEKIGVKKVICSTISSLKLEEERIDLIIKKGIDVLDMECSAFFAASEYAGLKSVALFYISDIINSAPFYNLSNSQKLSINSSIKKAVDFLCKLSEVKNG